MNTYTRHRFPPDIISYAVWLYYLSLANSYFKPLPAAETDRDNVFPIGNYRAR